MYIKIISCSSDKYWYRGMVGKTFEVLDKIHSGFVVKRNHLFISVVSFADAGFLNFTENENGGKNEASNGGKPM